jgi:hypothetical protein
MLAEGKTADCYIRSVMGLRPAIDPLLQKPPEVLDGGRQRRRPLQVLCHVYGGVCCAGRHGAGQYFAMRRTYSSPSMHVLSQRDCDARVAMGIPIVSAWKTQRGKRQGQDLCTRCLLKGVIQAHWASGI